MLLCLAITAARSCGDVKRREGISNCKTDRKLASTTTCLTAALKSVNKLIFMNDNTYGVL